MNYVTYKNPEIGIEIKYPFGWHVQDQDLPVKELMLIISEEDLTCKTESSNFIRNINIGAEILDLVNDPAYSSFKGRPRELLDEHAIHKIQTLQKNIENFSISSKEEAVVSYFPAIKIKYKGKMLDFLLAWIQYFTIIQGDLACTITATCLQARYNKEFDELVDEIVGSLVITP
ncbi:MAG: hypothetical protein ACTSRW_11910 [Candidatus Helarchaeota archaeon]